MNSKHPQKMNIIAKTRKIIHDDTLLKKGSTVLVGVSAGPDSVALLYVLNQLHYELGFHLCVAHINHQLRKNAAADQKFVERLCASLKIPYTALTITVKTRGEGGSLEEVAREKRLAALMAIAKQKRADTIALAHHRDDLAETVLMRVIRGTGLLGLTAILPKRELNGFKIIRPFIHISKKEILKFLKSNRFAYRVDQTNRQTRFFRNKLRLELIPLLERKYNRNIQESLAHLAQNAAIDYEYLKENAQKILSRWISASSKEIRIQIPQKDLLKLPPAMRRMVIRLSLEHLKGDLRRLTLTHVKEIEDLITNRPSGSVVHLPGRLSAIKHPTHLVLAIRNT